MRKSGFSTDEIWSPMYGISPRLKSRGFMKKGKHDTVERLDGEYGVSYRGNRIARVNPEKREMSLSSAGWQTATTKERLNKLLANVKGGGRIVQKNFKWYYATAKGSVPFEDGMKFEF